VTGASLWPSGFRWDQAQAYLFDIDGTLLNSRDGVHYNAFHVALREVFGIGRPIDGVPLHGSTDVAILRAVLRREAIAPAEIERKIPAMLARMCQEAARNAARMRPELCPSVRELLRWLHAAGRLLGVVSGNLEAIAWMKLEAGGIRRYFSFGCFSDRHETRTEIFRQGVKEARRRLSSPVAGNPGPAPPAAVCVVGDTPSDIAAARQAGVPVIAVATGIFGLRELLACRPDACVRCCTDLLRE